MTKGYYCGKKDMELLIEILTLRSSHLRRYAIAEGSRLDAHTIRFITTTQQTVLDLRDKIQTRYNHLYPAVPTKLPGE